MATDARMSTALPHHPKTVKLYRRLGAEGCWHLVCLFLWVAANRPIGNLEGMTDEDIEIAAGWNGKAGHFATTLAEVHFLDGDAGSRFVHDWAEHNPWAVSRDKRIASAKAAATARWERYADAERMRGVCDSHETAMPPTQPNRTQPIPNPTTTTLSQSQSQSSIGDKKKKRRNEGQDKDKTIKQNKRPSAFDGSSMDLPEWLPKESWLEWCQHRKEIKKPLTESAARKSISRLDRYRKEGYQSNDVIDHSIANGYQGLFPPPKEKTKKPSSGGYHPIETRAETAERLAREAREKARAV